MLIPCHPLRGSGSESRGNTRDRLVQTFQLAEKPVAISNTQGLGLLEQRERCLGFADVESVAEPVSEARACLGKQGVAYLHLLLHLGEVFKDDDTIHPSACIVPPL